ncbi:MAG: NYN domain-containing protein [Candidatus Magasanikbacteria bacterium]
MINNKNNVAYIDGANLHKAALQLDWGLDYARLRVWLTEKYGVKQAYLFLGLIPKYKNLYTYLQEVGFTLIFKEVTYYGKGKVKGNCDAELIVRAMKEAYENTHEKAVLVASDGDYAVLVSFLIEKQKFEIVLSPAPSAKCSILLKRTGAKISYISDQRSILAIIKEKTPDADRTA